MPEFPLNINIDFSNYINHNIIQSVNNNESQKSENIINNFKTLITKKFEMYCSLYESNKNDVSSNTYKKKCEHYEQILKSNNFS